MVKFYLKKIKEKIIKFLKSELNSHNSRNDEKSYKYSGSSHVDGQDFKAIFTLVLLYMFVKWLWSIYKRR